MGGGRGEEEDEQCKKSNVPPPKTKTLEPQVDKLYSIDEERVVKLSTEEMSFMR